MSSPRSHGAARPVRVDYLVGPAARLCFGTPGCGDRGLWRPDDDSPVLHHFLLAALSTPEPDVLGTPHARDGLGAAHL